MSYKYTGLHLQHAGGLLKYQYLLLLNVYVIHNGQQTSQSSSCSKAETLGYTSLLPKSKGKIKEKKTRKR